MWAATSNLGLSILGHVVRPFKLLGQWTLWVVTNGIRATRVHDHVVSGLRVDKEKTWVVTPFVGELKIFVDLH